MLLRPKNEKGREKERNKSAKKAKNKTNIKLNWQEQKQTIVGEDLIH